MRKMFIEWRTRRDIKRLGKSVHTFDIVQEVKHLMDSGMTQQQALAIINCIASYRLSEKAGH